jgi:uncharacterized protein with HEPN domain
MSMRNDLVSMRDMESYAREAIALMGDVDAEALGRNRVLQLALTRLVEIVGEAAHRVSEETRQAYPHIPWLQIIGMRNRLVHGYDVIDYDLLHDTIRMDLPPLIEALAEVVA